MTETPEDRDRIEKGLNRAVFSAHLRDLFSRLEIDCVLDVGAHRGEYGKLLRGTGYEGLIVSFEPVQEVFAALAEECSSDPLWAARRLALGSRRGQAEINVTRSTDFSSFERPSPYGADEFSGRIETERREGVPVRRLDEVFDECTAEVREPRVLLKVDVQGSELAVLDGATDCLPAVAAIQIETAAKPIYEGAPDYRDVISRLNGDGYELTGLFPVSRDRQLRIVELDCVLTRASDRWGHGPSR